MDTPVPAAPCAAPTTLTWHASGAEWFAAILRAIATARQAIELEFYIWTPGLLATRLELALVEALRRGCRVRLLVDAYGSPTLPRTGPAALIQAGAEFARFNPKRWLKLSFRDHRKLVVVDGQRAFIGGCNVADEYAGDGVTEGWRDLGLEIADGGCVMALRESFEAMWRIAPFETVSADDWREATGAARGMNWELLCAGAGRGGTRFRRRLHRDLARAKRIDVVAAYFVPSTRLRRLLAQRASAGRVRVVVPRMGDVPLAHWASRHVLERLETSRIEVHEYSPAMLHAKLLIADDVVYVGSANLDARSLRINFDLMLRIEDPFHAARTRALVEELLHHAPQRAPAATAPSRLERWRDRLSYLAVAWLDPYIARRKLRLLG